MIYVMLTVLLLGLASAAQMPVLHPGLNDFAGVVNGSDAQAINDLCTLLEKNTTVESAVLFVNSTSPYEIADFAVQTGQQNGIGKKEKDNGILMVIAVTDRNYYTAVGYGLEGDFPDGKIGEIQRAYLVPELKNGNWGKAALDTMTQYAIVLGAVNATAIDPPEVGAMAPIDPFVILVIVVVVVVLLIAFAAMTSGSGSSGSSGGGGYYGGGGYSGGSSGGSSGGGSFSGGSFGGGGAGGKW